MTYVGARCVLDVDSYLMEWLGFLIDYVDLVVWGCLFVIIGGLSGFEVIAVIYMFVECAVLEVLGDELVKRGLKWYVAFGVVDGVEWLSVFDLFGFEC